MRIGLVFSLAMGTALATGLVACDDTAGPSRYDQAAAMCGSSPISGPAEPPSPQFSCADGATSGAAGAQWGVLEGTLCLTEGIPAAGLAGAQCTDPSTMKVVVHEAGRQFYTAELVQGTLNDPHTLNPFEPCTPASAGAIDVDPGTSDAADSATFTITQKTADFVFGDDVSAPPICAVAISDTHHQQILVNVGMQIFVNCANESCIGSDAPSSKVWRRRNSLQASTLAVGDGAG